MRRLISAIWIIPFLMCLLVPASAHPGRTDGSGGHTNRSTGEYHYHHGYPAHDHYDMDGDGELDCPYDFKDNTADSIYDDSSPSKNSSSILSHSSGTTPMRNKSPATTEPIESEDMIVDLNAVLCIVAIAIATICVLWRIIVGKNRKIEELERENNYNRSAWENGLKKLHSDLCDKFGDCYLYKLCGAPTDAHIGEDNLPASNTTDAYMYKWGINYTFFKANSRFGDKGKFHRRSCRYANPDCQINAHSINKYPHRHQPCYMCSPSVPNTDWVSKYLSYKTFMKKYNIDITDSHSDN